jgi:hypothetical protein
VEPQGNAAQARDQGRRLPADFGRAEIVQSIDDATVKMKPPEMLAKPIYVLDGARTPFLKSKNRPGPFAAADLATQAGRSLLARQASRPTSWTR